MPVRGALQSNYSINYTETVQKLKRIEIENGQKENEKRYALVSYINFKFGYLYAVARS